MRDNDSSTRGAGPGGKRADSSSTSGDPTRVDRRAFLKATGSGIAITAAAGCMGDDSEEQGTSTPTEGETTTESGGATVGTTEAPSIDGPIRVGALGASNSAFGPTTFNAAELAAQQINDDGGIAGAEVEVITKDTQDDPATTRSVYQELTTGENVDVTTGIFGSESLLAILDTMAQQQTVHLTAGASTRKAAERVKQDYETYKYFFRVGPINDYFLAQSMLDFANASFEDMGFESVAVLAEDFEWTKIITERLGNELGDAGVDVPYNEAVPGSTEDFTPIYDEIESHDVDAVYTVLAHVGATSLVQWAKQQRPFQYGGIHVPAQLPTFYQQTQGAARFVFGQNTAVPQQGPTEKSTAFTDAYASEYDSYPIYNGYSAYDSLFIYRNAVERVGTTDPEEVVPALEETSYTGAGGHIEFYGQDEEYPHDVKYGADLARPLWYQWQEGDGDGNGAMEVIWPDELSTGEYTPAPWV